MLYTKVAVLVDRCFFLFIYFLRFLFSGRKIHFKDVCSCVRSTTIPCAYRISGVRAAKNECVIRSIKLIWLFFGIRCVLNGSKCKWGWKTFCLLSRTWMDFQEDERYRISFNVWICKSLHLGQKWHNFPHFAYMKEISPT